MESPLGGRPKGQNWPRCLCLNPCCNGIPSRGLKVILYEGEPQSLNPCCNGIPSRGASGAKAPVKFGETMAKIHTLLGESCEPNNLMRLADEELKKGKENV